MEDSVFEPIVLDSVADAVVAQIEKLIISGALKSGQKLPSEKRLSEVMGVSRPSIRDAARILEGRGLLVVKQGDGTYVADLIGPSLSPAMIDVLSRHKAYRDFLEYRHEFEGFAAHMAAERATKNDMEIIKRHLSEMEAEAASKKFLEEPNIDAGFHSAIVDAAYNIVLTHTMAPVYELMRRGVFYDRSLIERKPGVREALLAQHREIAEAIFSRDPERAAEAARAHIDFILDWYKIGSEEEGRDRNAAKRLSLMRSAQEYISAQHKDAKKAPARARGRPPKSAPKSAG
ncbi:MAG: FadR/GntR family transcriptional regulator [Paracoccaceae bacterium]